MKFSKSLSKIKKRYKEMRIHSLTQDNPLGALYRYVLLNIQFVTKKRVLKPWINNLKLVLQKGDAGLVSNYYYGLYEYKESLLLLHFLRKQDIFIDIGANMGHYSLLVGGCVGAKCISVEPIPSTGVRFRELIEINKLESVIEMHACGVSNKEGKLFFSTTNTVMNHVVTATHNRALEVPVQTIDKIVKNQDILCLKIDVEGYEWPALQGAQSVLGNPTLRLIIIELNESGNRYDVNDDQIVDLLESYGFKAYDYDPFNREFIQLSSYNRSQFNTVFIRDLSFVENRVKNGSKVKVLKMEI